MNLNQGLRSGYTYIIYVSLHNTDTSGFKAQTVTAEHRQTDINDQPQLEGSPASVTWIGYSF